MRTFGLVGFPLSHSFSKKYFSEKFSSSEFKKCVYENFELEDINEINALFKNRPDINGLNVTIPHKENVLPYLDKLDTTAQEIGAVNTIAFRGEEKIGFNTDVIGFKESLLPMLKPHMKKSLILGSGGASKAVIYVLNELGIQYQIVSRKKNASFLNYYEIDHELIHEHGLIINTTPLGMYPNVDDSPDLPYDAITSDHLLYDLVYNPLITEFMKKGQQQGAKTKNGLEMLKLQAEAAWKIWNKSDES